jgi:hypothetical protein
MSTMYIPSIVTGIAPTLIESMKIVGWFPPKIRVWMNNPFDIPMYLSSFQSIVTYWSQGRNVIMTKMNANLNIVLTAKATNFVDLAIPWTKTALRTPPQVNLTATTVMSMGEFSATVDYVQNDIDIRYPWSR